MNERIVTEENEMCRQCGCDVFVFVPENIDEEAGWECHNCGKDWRPLDKDGNWIL